MQLNENNIRDNAEYLWDEYSIMFAPEYDEKAPWWIPDTWANTTEDYKRLYEFRPFNTSLKVNPGDEIIITDFPTTVELSKIIGRGYLFEINNITNGDKVFMRYNPKQIRGLWPEDRYNLVMRFAAGLKDIPDVTIQFFILYTDDTVLEYIGLSEDDII